LLERGADVNAQSVYGATPLHQAAWRGHLLLLQTLLTAEPELNITTNGGTSDGIDFGMTPLILAIRRQSLPMVRALLDAGADVNDRNLYDRTALHYAAERAESKVIELLLDHGAEPNPVDYEGATPLALALKGGAQPDVIQLLRDRGGVSNPADDPK
jgi:ankyrin repeat protein